MDSTNVLPFSLESYVSEEVIAIFLRVALIILVGMPLILMFRSWARSFFTKRYASHYGMLAGKIVFYSGLTVLLITVMGQLGLSLAPLLGAAGILGVALGFASQTSVSNIISGLFLIAEQPFKVDDIIRVNQTTGFVLSIDVLSIKLRTFDNQFVRIPNETIIKTEVTNLTRFPIRRFNAMISVAYKEDIARVRDLLMEVADANEYVLKEPEPMVIFDAFGTSSIDLRFNVWAPSEYFLEVKDTIHEEIKVRFDEEGIEIPFPHLSLYSGQATDPIPVTLTGGAPSEPPEK